MMTFGAAGAGGREWDIFAKTTIARYNDMESEDPNVTGEKLQIAKKLAKSHYALETSITQIFTITDKVSVHVERATDPIKLLEVNPDTPPSGVMPISFGPSAEIPYPSVIVEVTPAEFEEIKTEKLKLPEGWGIGQELPKDGE